MQDGGQGDAPHWHTCAQPALLMGGVWGIEPMWQPWVSHLGGSCYFHAGSIHCGDAPHKPTVCLLALLSQGDPFPHLLAF